jgi:hypothetical protein
MFRPELVELMPAGMGNEMLAHNLRLSINDAALIPPADDRAEPALQRPSNGDALGCEMAPDACAYCVVLSFSVTTLRVLLCMTLWRRLLFRTPDRPMRTTCRRSRVGTCHPHRVPVTLP